MNKKAKHRRHQAKFAESAKCRRYEFGQV